ncbi:hypothetical protein B0J11DRAFT_230910 [Dendryphion nanum]|uniref:Uncharacterized protein n=1 Tax=Dendryphion nanum TaxID=256645 RepID=A0A9P9IVS1_9PLEO|nr:hypothetical protein B0J11DRAFT_230910 [Dendryphion nanum]
MRLSTLAPILLTGIFPQIALSLPVDQTPAVVLAKAHNIYLATCRKRSDGELTGKPFTAVAYFKNPIANSTEDDSDRTKERGPRADKSAVVADPAESWENTKYRLKVWRDKVFTTDITSTSEKTKGQLSGSVKLGTEDYVCFTDGVTKVRIKNDDDEEKNLVDQAALRGDCVADYWCAGLGKPKDDDKDDE